MNKIIESAIQDGVEKYAMNPIKLVTKPIGAVAKKLFGTTASAATQAARKTAPAAIQRIQAANPVAQQMAKSPIVATPKVDAEHVAKVTAAKAQISPEPVATPKSTGEPAAWYKNPRNLALIGGGAAALGIGAKMLMGHAQQQAMRKMLPYGAAALIGGGLVGRMTAPSQPTIVQS